MSTQNQSFDIIVVGGGHAGIEAAYAAAKLGCNTALITLNKHKIGLMPCNPSIGGIGKGHIVFEVSAFHGLMPQLCSKSYLQAHMLNTKKGPAVQGLRLQIDKNSYAKHATKMLEATPNLTIVEEMVDEIIVHKNQVTGIRCESGKTLTASQVILTTGTFLNGLIHVGEKSFAAGRQGEKAATKLSNFLTKLNLKMGRLKTGTPPRILTKTIDFSQLEKQEVEPLNYLYEFDPIQVKNTHSCYIARTNEKSHDIIRNNTHRSAMYSGNIQGVGPRYCPSIEDKVARFVDKSAHQIFVEPETKEHTECYPSGMSTSLPEDIQKEFFATIKGFENAEISKYGYAVEYDFVHPNQLTHALEVKAISGLFLAGQINGTTGYEEAAGQGLVAGINAAHKQLGKEPFILDRQESYIGVMIDDLITLGVDEPYRMFTSRAERRLILRQDNVFMRLMPKAYELGLVPSNLYKKFKHEKQTIEQVIEHLDKTYTNAQLVKKMEDEPHPDKLMNVLGVEVSSRGALTILSHIKYREYIRREQLEIEKFQKYKDCTMPSDEAVQNAPGISFELKQKISHHKPETIAQATLIPGMTPAAISMLIMLTRKPALRRSV